MNLKAPKTLAMLAAIITILFIGGVLLTGCEGIEASKADTDSQTVQAKACSPKTINPGCAAKKEVKTCPAKSTNPGFEAKNHPAECKKECCAAKKKAKTCPKMTGEKANPSECPMKHHSKTKDAKAHSTEHAKPCSK